MTSSLAEGVEAVAILGTDRVSRRYSARANLASGH